MRDQTIDEWLTELASAAPTPGGGGAAALLAATGAALVSMVCNLTIGRPRYAAHDELLRGVLAEATSLRATALRLADEDAVAFQAVIAAYRARSGSQAALVTAAEVPLRTAAVAARLIGLTREIADKSNPNVRSDVAVAATCADAALRAASVNVAVNLASIEDSAVRARLSAALDEHLAAAGTAADVIADVTAGIEAG